MPNVPHRILLIPTSNNIITNWVPAYQPLQDAGHSVFILQDNHGVNPDSKTPFTRINLNLSAKIRAAKRGLKRTFLQAKLIHAANRILRDHQITTVIVSNDNNPITNAFVNCAKAQGIPAVLHQATGLLYLRDDPTHPANTRTPPPWWMKKFLRFTSNAHIGGHVDECWTQGHAWAPYLHNNKVHVVGNAYYRQLKSEAQAVTQNEKTAFLKSHHLDTTKPTVTFYSQSFGKMKLLNAQTLPIFYGSINQLAKTLHPHANIIFKSHPAEFEHRQFLDTQHITIIETCNLTNLIVSSDFALGVFSTMAIQSRIAGITTLGYHPKLFPPIHLQIMAEAFQDAYDNVEDLAQRILNPPKTQSSQSDFHNKFDLNADTPALIVQHLDRLTSNTLPA